mgnify:CR=1 FL=1
MWDKCPPTYYVHLTANRGTRRTTPSVPFLPFSTCGRNSSRHLPPSNLYIHQNVPKREEERGRFRLRVSTEFSAGSTPDLRAVRCPWSRAVRFRDDLPFGPRLPLRRLDPTPVVGHSPRLLRLHACSVVLERPRACLSLSPVRTFTRRHAFVSDSRVGLLLLPIPFTSRHRPLLKVSPRHSGQPSETCEVRRRMAHPHFFAGIVLGLLDTVIHLLSLTWA